jgi:hypothetical protein
MEDDDDDDDDDDHENDESYDYNISQKKMSYDVLKERMRERKQRAIEGLR